MKKINLKKPLLLVSLFVGTLTACNHFERQSYHTSGSLKISFVDEQWGGQLVPLEEVCAADGGQGATPALQIDNIPQGHGINAIVVEFGDSSDFFMKGNGHGSIGMWIESAAQSVTVPSVPGGTTDNLPDNIFIYKNHKSGNFFRSDNGGYLPPCFGERKHDYYATVKAVVISESSLNRSEVFAIGKMYMGQY